MATLTEQNQLPFFGDSSNRSERHALKGSRQTVRPSGWNSEKQFIVVSAVQRQLQGIDSAAAIRIGDLHPWDLRTLGARTNSACGAEPREIAGKPVGEVYHRGGQATVAQPLAQCESWFGIEMFFQ